LTDLDCLAGDIVGHSPNGASALVVAWLAPSSGTISNLTMTIWYSHSTAGARSNDFLLQLDATTLTSGTVSNTSFFDRNNRDSYSNPGFAVNQGDVIALSIARTAGQTFGSLDGMTLDFTFDSSVPEPATLGGSLLCFGAMALYARKRRA
jgi:PEP-CTERM motif